MSKFYGSNSPDESKSKSKSGVEAPPEIILSGEAAVNEIRKQIPTVSELEAKQLGEYHDILMKFNSVLNLISLSTAPAAIGLHFADSVLASQLIVRTLMKDRPVYDLGSGNGFPGVVFGILNPHIPVILVDRDQRKTEFLKHVVSNFGLKNVTVEMKEAESLPERSLFNVICRGFAPLHKALLLTRKQIGVGGRFFHLKSDAWANELAGVPSQLFSYWAPSLLGQYQLPGTSSNMAVVLTEKIAD